MFVFPKMLEFECEKSTAYPQGRTIYVPVEDIGEIIVDKELKTVLVSFKREIKRDAFVAYWTVELALQLDFLCFPPKIVPVEEDKKGEK